MKTETSTKILLVALAALAIAGCIGKADDILVTAPEPDPVLPSGGGGGGGGDPVIPPTGPAALSVQLTVSPTLATVGQKIRVDIAVTNSGAAVAYDVAPASLEQLGTATW
jgi:hypothetical protein